MKAKHMIILATAAITFFLGACGNKTSGSPEQPETGVNTNVLYTCPMHPEVISNEPGDCPICGMKLVSARSAGAASDSVHMHADADSMMHTE